MKKLKTPLFIFVSLTLIAVSYQLFILQKDYRKANERIVEKDLQINQLSKELTLLIKNSENCKTQEQKQ